MAVNALPRLRISRRQFDALPEYSHSFPTGVYFGKLWTAQLASGHWIVRGYVEHPTDPGMAVTLVWKPFFTALDSPGVAESLRRYRRSAGIYSLEDIAAGEVPASKIAAL